MSYFVLSLAQNWDVWFIYCPEPLRHRLIAYVLYAIKRITWVDRFYRAVQT